MLTFSSRLAFFGVAAALGCSSASTGADVGADVLLDGAGRDGAVAPDADDGGAPSDAPSAADVDVEGGPLTFVVSAAELTAERRCDFDGDGVLDSSVADLGGSAPTLFTAAFNSIFQGHIEDGGRVLLHHPWVDDLRRLDDDHVLSITLTADAVEDPNDRTNDFSGEEPYYAHHGSLDGCGEPLFFSEVRISEGAISGEGGTFPLFVTPRRFAPASVGSIEGELSPDGRTGAIDICLCSTTRDLGATSLEPMGFEGSMLEAFLAGGAAFGVAAIPGLHPDVDLDGDGLERLELDSEGRIARCIDGDSTVIDGSDCYLDPRMADGFAFSARVEGVRAVFAGRQPNWEAFSEDEPCDSPPETSLLDEARER